MKKQTYQPPELRDASNNIVQAGTYGRYTPLANADNTGVLDYINNNLEALHDALLGDRVYVDSAKDLPTPGDVSVTYITGDSGEVYYYDPAKATYIAISQGKEYANRAVKSSAAAKTSEANAQSSASSASTSASSAKTSETNAKISETNASSSATTAKIWAVSETSPDGATDTDSTTGKTQSSRTWALESKANAQSASSSASTATTQASSATASAKSAASSATSASDSASSAASSAASASDSRDKASEYKTSASGSATAAASSASSASTAATNAKAAMNTANTAASSASTSATSASTSASNAAKAEVAAKAAQAEAEKARDDANSAVTKLTGVMKYAGQVDDYSDLSDKTKNKGDVWNVVNADDAHGVKAGDNVVWNGTDWDNLSGYVDLSAFAQKDDYQKVITSATANGATITFNHKDGTTSTATVNNVASSVSATNDAKGQKIDTTYEKIADASNVHTSLQNSINTKQDKLTFDTAPTANSSNPVTSDGVKKALDNKPDKTGEGASGTWNIDITGTATKASQDGNGNNIATTYETKTSHASDINSINNTINTKCLSSLTVTDASITATTVNGTKSTVTVNNVAHAGKASQDDKGQAIDISALKTLITTTVNDAVLQCKKDLYPVGSVYVSITDSRNPADILGFGTWEALPAGYGLVAQGTATAEDGSTLTFTAGQKSGEFKHQITVGELPKTKVYGTYDDGSPITISCTGEGVRVLNINTFNWSKNNGTANGGNVCISFGSSLYHNNISPSLVAYLWVRTD